MIRTMYNMEWGDPSIKNGEGNGTPLQYSCLEDPMDGGAWRAAVHGVVKSWTQLNDFAFTFRFHALVKELATHSSVLAWRIPGMGEPGGLPSLGSHRVGHNWSDLAAAAAATSKKNKTLPGERGAASELSLWAMSVVQKQEQAGECQGGK